METCGTISITDRRKIELTGIKSVESFDEYTILLSADGAKLTVEGEQLNITVLDLERGKICAEGIIGAVFYSDSTEHRSKNFFAKLFGSDK